MIVAGTHKSNGNDTNHGSSTVNSSQPKNVLEEFGICGGVASVFQPLYENGKLKRNDFDDRAIDAMKSLSIIDAVEIAQIFANNDLDLIPNKSAHLCSNIRYVRLRRKNTPCLVYTEVHKPDEAVMNQICARTGYPYEKTSGQRKYGPAPHIETPPAANGHEIYIGSIPYAVCEDQLIPMMETCGTIYDLRMMVDPTTGRNKGFCFVTFVEDDAVEKAVEKFNGLELIPGIKIRVNPSIPNLKLSILNMPTSKSKEEIMEEFSKHLEGVVDVEIVSSSSCVVTFDLHRHASSARRKLFSARVKPFDIPVWVDWHVSDDSTDDLSLYVRNYDPNVSDSEYMSIFGKFGTVVRINRYSGNVLFVHYSSKKNAADSVRYFNKRAVGNRVIEVSFAKPSKRDKRDPKFSIPFLFEQYCYPPIDSYYPITPYYCCQVYPDGTYEYPSQPVSTAFPCIPVDFSGTSFYNYYTPIEQNNGTYQISDIENRASESNGNSNGNTGFNNGNVSPVDGTPM